MNCWWSFANQKAIAPVTQRFHRDPDDFKFVALFIYLTDTKVNDGNHQILKHTHDFEQNQRYLERIRAEKKIPVSVLKQFMDASLKHDGNNQYLDSFIEKHLNDNIGNLHGLAGTAFMEDAWALHRAVPIKQKDRLVIWCRYGVGTNSETFLNGLTKPVLTKENLINNIERYTFRKFIISK